MLFHAAPRKILHAVCFRITLNFSLTVVSTVISVAAGAQSAEDIRLCGSLDLPSDQGIAACTGIIQSVGIPPSHIAWAYCTRGEIYRQHWQLDRAASDFDAAVALAPNDVSSYLCRANGFVAKGQFDKALDDYNTAIRLDSRSVSAYIGLGNANLYKKSNDAALADYSEAIKLDPTNAYALMDRGRAYLAKGNYDAAIVDLNEAARLRPSFAGIYYVRGDVY